MNNITKYVQESINNCENPLKISTGYVDLDHRLDGGFSNSNLIIIGGRTSMGKTALALNLVLNACEDMIAKYKGEGLSPSVGFFSLEMSGEQLTTRMISILTEINSRYIQKEMLNDTSYNLVHEKALELSKQQIFIDDTPSLSITEIIRRAKDMKDQHNISILFIDHLQLIESENKKTENQTYYEISEIIKALKGLSKELNIPIIVLSQLSRAIENRENKRPVLSDLRDSGYIEEVADIVMLLYREEYYLIRKEPLSGDMQHAAWLLKLNQYYNQFEIEIVKNRHGYCPCCVLLSYDHDCSKIKDLEKPFIPIGEKS